MNEHSSPDSPTPAADARPAAGGARPRGTRRRFWALAGVAGALATLAACAQPGPGGPGPGPGGPGMMGWHHHRHGAGPMDPEAMARRIDKGVEWVLSDVGASPEQKQKVAAIAKQAAAEMAPLRERHVKARQQAMDILAAPSVDRAALEKLRADELQAAEGVSRRITQALGDIAEVLTPEQRAKLKERMQQRMGRRWG
jgi:Spy/CpxP family protein refolding chaperone